MSKKTSIAAPSSLPSSSLEGIRSLLTPVSELPGAGPKLVELLAKLSIITLFDLVTHLPVKVIDRRFSPDLTAISEPPDGVVTLLVDILSYQFPPKQRGQSRPHARPYHILCRQAGFNQHDGNNRLDLVFFQADARYLTYAYPLGSQRAISGRIERHAGRRYWTMTHPDRVVPAEQLEELRRIEPVYPLTTGLNASTLSKIMRIALNHLPSLPEWIHPQRLGIEGWPSWNESIVNIHQPRDHTDISPTSSPRKRLAYDELLASQLMLILGHKNRTHVKGRALRGDGHLVSQLTLPFLLTRDQEQAVEAIKDGMAMSKPMTHLLQGDVGSGKTVVALLAMLTAVEAGVQTALMAPTELLAYQHYKNFLTWLAPLDIPIGLLTGRMSKRDSQAIREKLDKGLLPIVIGTHALIEDKTSFHNLGLVVIDEQHRFGVHQRFDLMTKGRLHTTDLLVTTATPIPRTQLLTLYGNMSVTYLRSKPPGRLPITTRAIPIRRLDDVLNGLERVLSRGEKIYWICPLVAESEKLDLEAAETRYRCLAKRFPGRVGLLHGRMKKPSEKDSIMKRFTLTQPANFPNQEQPIDLLVATTIVEVGVDIPEASVMIIEHAERFGLAQLHQLRGRIGRGTLSSSCILLHNASSLARERLSVLCKTEDGFHIAEEDLRLRGGGDVLGTRQSGLPHFRLVDWSAHADLLSLASQDARSLLAAQSKSEDKALQGLLQLFQRKMSLYTSLDIS